MKSYQDHDELHGHGKAIPHPKRPTRYTYRGDSLGAPVAIERERLEKKRNSKVTKSKATFRQKFTIAGVIAMMASKIRGGRR